VYFDILGYTYVLKVQFYVYTEHFNCNRTLNDLVRKSREQ